MKSKKIFFFLITILLINFLFISKNKKSSFDSKLFSISDTLSINKIVITDRYSGEIELKRIKNKWILNSTYLVRNDAINSLLTTIKNIRIKNLLSKEFEKNIEKQIATFGVGVKIYNNNKNINSFIIGPSTHDHLGTYIFHMKTKKTYTTYIPGFNGFLSPRFGIQANRIQISNWRNPTLINYDSNSIDSIFSYDFFDKSKSFKVINGENNFVKNFENDTLKDINLFNLNTFVNSFSNLKVERFLSDSLKPPLSKPYKKIIIYSKENTDSVIFYKIMNKIDSDTNSYKIERKYAIKNDKEISIVQDYVFNKVLINIDDFK